MIFFHELNDAFTGAWFQIILPPIDLCFFLLSNGIGRMCVSREGRRQRYINKTKQSSFAKHLYRLTLITCKFPVIFILLLRLLWWNIACIKYANCVPPRVEFQPKKRGKEEEEEETNPYAESEGKKLKKFNCSIMIITAINGHNLTFSFIDCS